MPGSAHRFGRKRETHRHSAIGADGTNALPAKRFAQ